MKLSTYTFIVCMFTACAASLAQSSEEMVSLAERDLTGRFKGALITDTGFSVQLTSPETEARLLYEISAWPETITGKKEYASYDDALLRFRQQNKGYISDDFGEKYHLYFVNKVFRYAENNFSVVESYFIVDKKNDRVFQVAVVGYLCDSTASDTNHAGKAKRNEQDEQRLGAGALGLKNKANPGSKELPSKQSHGEPEKNLRAPPFAPGKVDKENVSPIDVEHPAPKP